MARLNMAADSEELDGSLDVTVEDGRLFSNTPQFRSLLEQEEVSCFFYSVKLKVETEIGL